MKKSLLVLVAAAAAWTGCSKTETIDQPQDKTPSTNLLSMADITT